MSPAGASSHTGQRTVSTGMSISSSSAQRVSAVTATPPSFRASARHARSPSESPADRVTCQSSAAARASSDIERVEPNAESLEVDLEPVGIDAVLFGLLEHFGDVHARHLRIVQRCLDKIRAGLLLEEREHGRGVEDPNGAPGAQRSSSRRASFVRSSISSRLRLVDRGVAANRRRMRSSTTDRGSRISRPPRVVALRVEPSSRPSSRRSSAGTTILPCGPILTTVASGISWSMP